MKTESLFVVFLGVVLAPEALAFAPSSAVLPHAQVPSIQGFASGRTTLTIPLNEVDASKSIGSTSSTQLSMLPAMAASLPVFRKVSLIGAALALILNFRRILWPNGSPDKSVDAPLPPGSMGCPLFGHGVKVVLGTKRFGPGMFYFNLFQKVKSKIAKYYAFGQAVVALSDGEKIREILASEFEEDGVKNSVMPNGILGPESVLGESDRKRHASIRRMVGQAMTPAAVSQGIPILQEAAQTQVDAMLNASPDSVSGDELCNRYTLDVAWKQILGLDLEEEEVPVFEKAVNDWLMGFADPSTNLGFRLEFLPHWKALDYLKTRIGQKIDELEEKGPDASTLSGMVFAVDEEDSSRKLSKTEIIDNVLVLILAGSETSAGTLASALLAMKLNPDTWTKLVDEQKAMIEKHGEALTRATLDEECPYLDAVIRETMRIRPLNSGAPRILKGTKVVDGYQLPKNWMVFWSPFNTHYNDPTTYEEDGAHMDLKRGFKPERWLSEETKPTTNYIPMGAGPRYCLGSVLAFAEMKVFLAMIARNVDYKLVSSYDDFIEWRKISIIPRVLDGVPIVASKQTLVADKAEAVVV